MHHFPLHIGDFSQATARFKLVHVGIYTRLLLEYYKDEKALTDDIAELAFTIGADTTSEKDALRMVLKRCFDHDEARKVYVQKRCEEELVNFRASVLQSRFANLGRHWDKVNKGYDKPLYEDFIKNPDSYFEEHTGRVRKATDRNILVLTSEPEKVTPRTSAGSHPIPNTQDPIPMVSPIVPDGTYVVKPPTDENVYEAIYGLYPRKVGKGKALTAIQKSLKRSGLTELEMQGKVRQYAECVSRWPKEDLQFVPNPATWFNQDRFADDTSTWERNSANSTPGFSPQKKEGGAAPDAPISRGTAAPEGWEEAMLDLWGPDWKDTYPAWDIMLPADQRQVREWLKKNKGGGAA